MKLAALAGLVLFGLTSTASAACEPTFFTLVRSGVDLGETMKYPVPEGIDVFAVNADPAANSVRIETCFNEADVSSTVTGITVKSFGRNIGKWEINEVKNIDTVAFDPTGPEFLLKATDKNNGQTITIRQVETNGTKLFMLYALRERNGKVRQAMDPSPTIGEFRFGDLLTDNPCALKGGSGPVDKVVSIGKLTLTGKACEFMGTSGTYQYNFIELSLSDKHQTLSTNFSAPLVLKGEELEKAMKLDVGHHNYTDTLVITLPFATYAFDAHTVYSAEPSNFTNLKVTDKDGNALYEAGARCHVFKDKECK